MLVPQEEEEQRRKKKDEEEAGRGVPFYRAAAADVQRVVARERAARDAARKAREDPMVRVAQCLGDDSFLHPRTAEGAHSRPVSHKHSHHKHHHRHRHRHKHDDDDSALRALRAERLAREARERARTAQLLQESTTAPPTTR